MHLWTEYEGRTVAEHFLLGKLLRSEGRNGFFATTDRAGKPAVIRLTEVHYDEAEQLRRWREVAAVHQENLIQIDQVGQTSLESVALTYALMEPDDANLGDVLADRPLNAEETMQVARGVLLALRALHAANLVHEHVEPVNVFAVGETVKLRSDCVRECVADGEFTTPEGCAELRKRDLHDYGKLLLRCLTLETEWMGAHNNLPDPFKRVLPKALDGSWSLDQLGAALDSALFQTAPAATASRPLATATVPVAAPTSSAPSPAAAPDFTPVTPAETATAPHKPLVPPGVLATAAAAESVPPRRAGFEPEAATSSRQIFRADEPEPAQTPSWGLWIGIAVAAVVLLLLGWHFFGGSKPAAVPASPTASAETGVPAASPTRAAPAAAAVAPTPASQPAAADTETTTPGAHGWYVVAYTYNHQGQAANKVRALRRHHNSLDPQVFSPAGHAPFFVALGGAMSSQDQAEAVYRRARRNGLPRDTFVRHY